MQLVVEWLYEILAITIQGMAAPGDRRVLLLSIVSPHHTCPFAINCEITVATVLDGMTNPILPGLSLVRGHRFWFVLHLISDTPHGLKPNGFSLVRFLPTSYTGMRSEPHANGACHRPNYWQ